MRHRRLRPKLGVGSQHRKALLRNLMRGLVAHRRIRTTLAKAKAASSFADRLVHLAKRGDLHARRLLVSKLGCPDTADALIRVIAPHFKERQGGYTRVLRLGVTRPGDRSDLALLEFTETIHAPQKVEKPKKAKKPKAPKPEEEKPEKQKARREAPPAKAEKKIPSEEEKKAEKKESEKKGGFLSRLRKFLKGDEE